MTPAEETVRRIGRYEIVRKIATGGMAELFLGKFTGPGGFEKRCALKRILPQFAADDTFKRMFQTEARVSAMFDHPNVVQVFELGEDEKGQFYIAMELVNGVNLRQLIGMARDAGQRIPPALAAYMVTQALDGLAYAHGFRDPDTGAPLNLVHRDISPQNILVSYEGAVKLVDFGIVKGSSISSETQAGMLKGKVAYMSPEQASGEPLDGRSDLFSLGVCFYELIAGQRPFQGQNDIMTLKAILDEPTPPLTTFTPDVAEGIEHSIYRALEKFPDQRYPSAREFHLELQHILRDCPTPLGRHVVSDYIRALTEGDTVSFDATALAIPRGLRSPAGFGLGTSARPPSGSNGGLAAQDPTSGPAAPAAAWTSPPATSSPGIDYRTPPPPSLEAEPRTPLPLDESIGGTSEMIRQAGLPSPKRRGRGWMLFVLSVAVGAAAVGLFIEQSRGVVVVEPATATGRIVDVVEDVPPLEPAAEAPAEAPRPASPAEPPKAAEPPPPTVSKVDPPPKRRRPARRRRSRRPTPAPSPTGQVSVSSVPEGLTVVSGGEVLGKTPLKARLAPGQHTLVLTSRSLGVRRKVTVEVTEDGIATARVEVGRGTLKVVSRPWAEVYVNGEHKGKTPLTLPLFEGRQTVKLVTEDKRERIQTVRIRPDEESLVRVKF